ncbi:ribosome-associated translation inhibitor RaiA [Candidatus Saccharibacteria bacterium]|nr:ribosome-associated translation inhibitor RaiA [Candidatus Saccharibacteria bacterium]
MIKLDVSGRNYEVDKRLKDYLEDKIGGLERYLPRQLKDSAEAVAVLSDDKSGREDNRFVCEVIMKVSGEKFVAKEGTVNMYAAIDIVDAKLKAQLATFKDKYTLEPRRAKMLGRLVGRTSEADEPLAEPAAE